MFCRYHDVLGLSLCQALYWHQCAAVKMDNIPTITNHIKKAKKSFLIIIIAMNKNNTIITRIS